MFFILNYTYEKRVKKEASIISGLYAIDLFSVYGDISATNIKKMIYDLNIFILSDNEHSIEQQYLLTEYRMQFLFVCRVYESILR